MAALSSNSFRFISRTCIALYRTFPVFGALRGALAVVRRDDGYVMVERADGPGMGFPGGLVHPWEQPESAVRREVLEETGLTLTRVEGWFDYYDRQLYPTHVFVFRAEASGDVRDSWEGTVVQASLPEMAANIIVSQREVVERLRKAEDGHKYRVGL